MSVGQGDEQLYSMYARTMCYSVLSYQTQQVAEGECLGVAKRMMKKGDIGPSAQERV